MYKVAVLISVYEAEEYIDSKLTSVLNQTMFDTCTFLFVSCQSKRDVVSKINDFCAAYKNCKHIESREYITIYEAWNIGIENSDSQYLANYNMDDQWHPEYLSKCSKILDETNAAIAITEILVTDTPNQLYPFWHHVDKIPSGLYPDFVVGPSPMWRRDLHEKYGLFENYYVISDALMWDKFHKGNEKFILVKEELVLYLRNPLSLERRHHDESGERLINVDLKKKYGN
jgi:glycosyltransferase involved in cell wall biosynthesis